MRIVENYKAYRECMTWQDAVQTALAERVTSRLHQVRALLGLGAPTMRGAMQWFKHPANFADTPTMKLIERAGGLDAVAVAYRLLEFMAGRHGTDEGNFEGYLEMTPPNTKAMLAEKLVGLVSDEESFGVSSPAKEEHLEKYLDLFMVAGLIERGTLTTEGTTLDKDNKRVPCVNEWETLRLLKLVDKWEDEYTTKKRRAVSR